MPRHVQIVVLFKIALLLCLAGCPALAQKVQKPATQKNVKVTVVDAHVDPAQPVGAVRVSLTYLDGTSLKTDARNVTTPRGEAFLEVSPDTAQRDDLRLIVEGNPDLVIFEPADGQLHGISSTVPVKLLPKGSEALSNPAHIEAVQRRLAQRVSSQQRQIAQKDKEIQGLQTQLQSAQALADTQKEGVNAGLEEWARANGLDLSTVQKQVNEWAQTVQKDPAASADQRGLAEFALKNFGAAGDSFRDAKYERRKKALEQERQAAQGELEEAQKEANAYQLAARFHDATAALEETRDYIAARQKASPEDAGLQRLWLQAVSAVANARESEAQVVDPSLSLGLLQQSARDFVTLQVQYTGLGDNHNAAKAEKDGADVLLAETDHTSYTEAEFLLNKLIPIYKHVLEELPREKFPEDWANTQIKLGNALLGKGERDTGDGDSEGPVTFLEEAVRRLRSAMEVYSRANHPQEWAAISKDIGETLGIEGELTTSRSQRVEAVNGAVEALQNALKVYSEQANPQEWALTQMQLGYVLTDLGRSQSGDQRLGTLNEAVNAYQHALNVYKKETLPQPWANAEVHLSWGLETLAHFVPTKASVDYLRQAIEASNRHLEIHTRVNDPIGWTLVKDQIGWDYWAIADQVSPEQARLELDKALLSFRDGLVALSGSTDPEAPFMVSLSKQDIGDTLLREAALADKQNRAPLFEEASANLRSSLSLLDEYCDKGKWFPHYENLRLTVARLLNRAEIGLGHEPLSNDFFETKLKDGTDPKATLSLFTDLYHEKLFRFQRAFELDQQLLTLDPSSTQRLNYMEASLSAEHFDICLAQVAPLDHAKLDAPNSLVRDLLRMSCNWAAGDKADALIAENDLLGESAGFDKGVWNFTGTLHFLANSSKFETGRAVWIALFTSAQNGDTTGMNKALHELQPLMQK